MPETERLELINNNTTTTTTTTTTTVHSIIDRYDTQKKHFRRRRRRAFSARVVAASLSVKSSIASPFLRAAIKIGVIFPREEETWHKGKDDGHKNTHHVVDER